MIQLDADVETWSRSVGQKIMYEKGASGSSALQFARLYGYAFMQGLGPYVTRIYSSRSRQMELQQKWDAGQREGLRVRPATTSKHIREDRGQMASDAIDMPCSDLDNDRKCAIIARDIGLRAGEDFKVTDSGHYDVP